MIHSKGRIGIVVGALIVGIVIGVLLGVGFDRDRNPPDQNPNSSAAGPGPTTEVSGVPVGYARTDEGAFAAARSLALLTATDIIRDKDAYLKAMETIAAPGWLAQARKQAINGYEFLVDRYGDDVDVSAAVLRYKILDFSPTQAEVKLWVVSLAAGSGRSTVDEVWGTAIVQLVWLNGDWRVSGSENSTGPAPVDIPTASSTESAASLMEELDDASDWVP